MTPVPRRAVLMATSPLFFRWFMEGHVRALQAGGWDVRLVSGHGPELAPFAALTGAPAHPVALEREIRPGSDVRALVELVRLFRGLRPALVHASTPKAGLFGMLAAWLVGVPVRVYHCHGLRYETARGALRAVLWGAERVACGLATHVLAVSGSLAEALVERGLCGEAKVEVLHRGSVSGVEAVRRFVPWAAPRLRAACGGATLGATGGGATGGAYAGEATGVGATGGATGGASAGAATGGEAAGGASAGEATGGGATGEASAGAAARRRLGLPAAARVVGFVGRVVKDKGVVTLWEAWQVLREALPDLHWVLVGPVEDGDPVPPQVLAGMRADPRVHLLGQDEETPPLFAAMDVVALPSFREGFGLVTVEAGAMGLPVVASRVMGIVDAVVDGETGTLVPAGDVAALAAALRAYLVDPDLRERHGAAGRARALRDFEPAALERALVGRYERWTGRG